MGQPEIFRGLIPKNTIQRLADEEFGNMVKFVVDLEREMLCAGGGLHSDEEQMLLDQGSKQSHLWGANFYLERPHAQRYEFTSMINIRPSDGNRSQAIASTEICKRVAALADRFFNLFMRNHKSIKPEDLVKKGPEKIALMVASEFLRASSGSEFHADVIRCYDRARELMGVLETVPLDEKTGSYLKPFYDECMNRNLLKEEQLNSAFVKAFGLRIAQAFEIASSMISTKASHA